MNDTPALDAHFEVLFRWEDDPWGTRVRWYERRKRALTLAMLPAARYRRAFEPGCAVGELTAALAERCHALVAADASPTAVAHARRRPDALPNVTLRAGRLPDDRPDGRFDLVVVSELGYYLEPPALARVAALARASADEPATLVACHRRRGAADLLQNAAQVHATLGAGFGGRRVGHYEDDDFLLDVWCDDPRSPAQREGLA